MIGDMSLTADPSSLGISSSRSSGTNAALSAALSRSEGCLRLSFKRRDLKTMPDEFFQSGCSRVRLLAGEPGRSAEMIIINTAGGLTGGDAITASVRWGTDAAMTLTGQASEKIYRTLAKPVKITTDLVLENGSVGEWLPQETILFNRAALQRRTHVHMAATASFLGLEAVVLGRTAMQEDVDTGYLRDAWRIWREGKTIYSDVIELTGDISQKLQRSAITRRAIAFASLIYAAPGSAEKLPGLRASLSDAQSTAAASAWNDLVAIRLIADTGAALRRDIIKVLNFLRPGRTLPRVWRC